MLRRSARKRKASSFPYSTVIAASRKKPSSAVATTVDGANLVSCPLPYNQVPVSLSTSSPYNSVQLPVSSSIGTMGVSANITSLPQPAPIMLPQTTDHSTDQVPFNITTSGSNSGNTGNLDTTVWIVGSSIIKDEFVSARSCPGGTCLGLSPLNVSIWWQGKQGMVVRQIKGQIRLMKKFEDAPQFIILHVAGNDLGYKKVGFLRNNIKNIIRWILIELYSYQIQQ